LSETFLIPRRIALDMIKNAYWSACKIPLACLILMKLEFSLQIFEKYSNVKFLENPSNGSHVVPFNHNWQTWQS